MRNNITRADLDALIGFLKQDDPILTQSKQVEAFEQEWSEWLGVKHSVFLNSGSSANEITMLALRELHGTGEVIVPPLTWVSDIASVLHAGFTPVFADINPHTLGMDSAEVIKKITPRTKAVFLTHILGYNALDDALIDACASRGIPLIEDVCESHGATFDGRKCGTFGFASNFSFYYAHHLSTIEGGMVCTDNAELYELCRVARSHGMVRESRDETFRARYTTEFADLNPAFIFAFPAHNMRGTEINAVLGRSQLPRLDANNATRSRNLRRFLDGLDPSKFRTDFAVEGSSNYAFTLVLREPDEPLRDRCMEAMTAAGVEFRRGTSGGGNQLRQPYLRRLLGDEYKNYPQVDHIHFFGFYIGNYPDLESEKIDALCRLLNAL
ncbi:MAG: DegT/DnrJ/EryC1/StrS family aminotransferase [Verrucomicrobia bacterium]|nr:DegT/DnrJ/EryC1/StrS family aminotransferase [Verrucomicrobiota bacterium]